MHSHLSLFAGAVIFATGLWIGHGGHCPGSASDVQAATVSDLQATEGHMLTAVDTVFQSVASAKVIVIERTRP